MLLPDMRFFQIAALGFWLALTGASTGSPLQSGPETPVVRQKNGAECGRAVIASLVARKGGDPEEIYRHVAAPKAGDGYSIVELQMEAKRFGIQLTRHVPAGVVIGTECRITDAVLSHLKHLTVLVNTGKPVVVPVYIDKVGGHFVILSRFDVERNVFTLVDPMYDKPRRWTAGELAIRMCKFGFLALEAR